MNFPGIFRISRSLALAIDKYFNFPKYKFDRNVHHWIDLRYKQSNQHLSQWVAKEKLARWGYPLSKVFTSSKNSPVWHHKKNI